VTSSGPATPVAVQSLRRLSARTLAQVRAEVLRPAYERTSTAIGTVHFGPGAFHRAHQAFYFDRLLEHLRSLC